jgi:DNA polymerase IV
VLNSQPDLSLDQVPILHIDLDSFFASVEVLDDPTLRGKPVCVGGPSERGVIASASYEARQFGVRSGMPSSWALRLCPEIVLLPGRFWRYEEYSEKFHGIVADVTPNYEEIGLDEVFCDLRGLHLLGRRPLEVATQLRGRIQSELNLACGVGLARNKLFGKLASKRSKPRVVDGQLVAGPGVVVVDRATEIEWLNELPVGALWGVGPATTRHLENLGLSMVRDLARVDESTLIAHFGESLGTMLAAYARGEDAREVEVDRAAKSIGRDETFGQSLVGLDQAVVAARAHAGIVARTLRDRQLMARTISVKIRFDDWDDLTRSQTMPFGVDDEDAIASVATALLTTVDLSRSVRLLGVHVSNFMQRNENTVQLAFGLGDSPTNVKVQAEITSRERQVAREALREAIDEVRHRFGRDAVAVAAELGDEGIEVRGQRDRDVFGPSA